MGAVLLFVVVTFWGGFEAVRATVDFTLEYQSLRPNWGLRVRQAATAYWTWFGWVVPAAAVVSLAGASLPAR